MVGFFYKTDVLHDAHRRGVGCRLVLSLVSPASDLCSYRHVNFLDVFVSVSPKMKLLGLLMR
jgi:hypothetical protein